MPQPVPSLARMCLVSLLVTLWVAQPARALSLLRDADLEHALRLVVASLLKVAGLRAKRLEILIVDDRSLNAFGVDRHHIFLHSGLIMKMDTSEMFHSVIAHEAAHITNGHKPTAPAGLPQLIVQARDGCDAGVMQDLAQAYADKGGISRSSLATAERYAMVG
ncbi:MAG: M48 family metalloprotease [Pseudomonadota bacterium]